MTEQQVRTHHVWYFFESGDWKLVVMYVRRSGHGIEEDKVIDKAMESMRFSLDKPYELQASLRELERWL